MNENFWLIAFVLLCMVSCNQRKVDSEYTLKSTDSLLRIELDSLTSNVSYWLDYHYDEELDSGLLFSIDPANNELELYSLTAGKLVQKVAYDREGPNGVGNLTAAAVLGLDSVLIFPSFSDSFFKSNLKNLELTKVLYDKPDEYSSIRSETRYFRSIPFSKAGYLYTKTFFGGNYMLLENEELSSKPLMYSVDLANGAVEFSAFTFPDDYWADGKRHFEFSSALNNDRFAFSFHSDHNIYYGTSFAEPLNRKPAKSKYLSQELEDLPLGSDSNARRRYFATTGHYGNLIYDQFRNVYYRFCYPKKEVEADQDLREMIGFPEEFSVMIFNSELEVIGETLIGDNDHLYIASNVFVGPKGLYISVNHPKSELNEEDSFGFQLFTLDVVVK